MKIERYLYGLVFGSPKRKTTRKRKYRAPISNNSSEAELKTSLSELEAENKALAQENDELTSRLDDVATKITAILKDSISPEIVCVEIEGCESKDSLNELYASARTLFSKMNIIFTKDQICRIEKRRAELEKKNYNISGNYIENQTNNY